jgi:hypothetical protein
MHPPRHLLCLLLLLALTAPAAEFIVRDPVLRSVSSNWTDLGSAVYPFKTAYVCGIILNGQSLTNGGGGGGGTVTNYITTNTVTVYNLTNAVLSSQKLITFSTNNAAWGASNYLARVQGIYSWRIDGGNDGGNPPMAIPMKLVGSYNGTSGWFELTNGFLTTNTISVAALTNGYAASGGRRVTLGMGILYSVDHFELLGRTNYLFGQRTRFDAPIDASDATTKEYVDMAIANVTDANFTSYAETNGTTHLIYKRNLMTIWDISSLTAWVPIATFSLDGTGTNVVMGIWQTNLTAGWFIESSTNLALANSWATWTNYTMATNSGVVSFTLPLEPGISARYFRGRGNSTNSVSISAPLTVGGNFQIFSQTNTPTFADIGSQRGGRLWVSNGFVYFTGSTNGTTIYTTKLAP